MTYLIIGLRKRADEIDDSVLATCTIASVKSFYFSSLVPKIA
jgi:hypothetical protein